MTALFDPQLPDQPAAFPLSSIPAQPLDWLWPNRIPFAHLTILYSLSGLGLSLVSLHLAACVSSGRPLPDGSPCPQGTVLLVSPFDSPAHTITPRLEAAGGDPNHVLMLTSVPVPPPARSSRRLPAEAARPFSLAHDLPLLETTIQQSNARLVILDTPDLARDSFLRPLLPRLAALAARTNCAILLLRPLSRPLANPFNSALQHTLPLIAYVHSALYLAAGPSDNERLLLCPKHTLSTASPALRFDLTLSPTGIPLLQPLGLITEPDDPAPVTSFQRQHLLRTLQEAPAPLSPHALAALTFSSYEATRKMLQRLLHDGDLVSPARGLYTTPDHPSLQSPVPDVPTVPSDPSS